MNNENGVYHIDQVIFEVKENSLIPKTSFKRKNNNNKNNVFYAFDSYKSS